MSLKYITNLLVLVAGAFLVVASRVFAPDTAGWLGLGVGIFAVLLAGVGLASARLQPRAIGYGVTAIVGAWTIVASVVFSGTVQGWLVFADALALAAVAMVELIVHEVTTERVVHTLVVSQDRELQAA